MTLLQSISRGDKTLTNLLNQMPVPIYFSDGRGRYLACNTAFETFAGIRASELVGKSVFELWSDPDARAFFADDRDVFLNPRLHVYDASLSLASKETRMVGSIKLPYATEAVPSRVSWFSSST